MERLRNAGDRLDRSIGTLPLPLATGVISLNGGFGDSFPARALSRPHWEINGRSRAAW